MHSLPSVLFFSLYATSVCHCTASLDNYRNKTERSYSVLIVGAGVAGISAGASLLQAGVNDVVILEASDRIGGRIQTVQFGEFVRNSVLIVGAGVAGISSGASLLQAGVKDVLILEASDRIGGRKHTVQFGGNTLDLGAEFVHGQEGNTVYQMLRPYNLLTSYHLVQRDDDFLFVNSTGATFNPRVVRGWFRRAYDILGEDGLEEFNASVYQYLAPRLSYEFKREDVPKIIQDIVWYLVTQSEGVENASENLEELGARGYSQFLSQGDYEQKFKRVGYEIIFDILTKRFPNTKEELPVRNKTLLGKQVEKVKVEEDGSSRVSCSDGSTYLADHVIVTTSLGVLKKHAADMFHPALPQSKMAAIQTLGFGTVDKVFLLFPNRWWPRNITTIDPVFTDKELKKFVAESKHGYWTVFNTGYQPVMSDDRMLCVWLYGEAARTMELLTEQEVVDGLLELLNYFLADRFNISRPVSILRSEWFNNKYTRGSYSFNTVDSDDQGLSQRNLSEAVYDSQDKPVWLFAGEATSTHHYSTVHGALDSSRRAAKIIINYINKSLTSANMA